MKKLIITALALCVFSCKKKEIAPQSCYLFQSETITTYPAETEERFQFPNGKIERSQYLQCEVNELTLADLLKTLNTTTKNGGICITVHTVAIKQSKK